MGIKIENLSYSYGDGTKALKNIDLDIKDGEKLCIVGANGCGKSTLFLCLNGILKGQQGTISLDNEVYKYDKKGLVNVRKNVGIVFQDPETQLFCITVWEEAAFAPKNLGYKREELNEAVSKSLKSVDVFSLKDKAPHEISYGQKKRVSMASVLSVSPKIVVFDEPTSALDPMHKNQIISMMDGLNDDGKTIIMSTHDMDLVYSWADRVVVMKEGEIVGMGTPYDIFSNRGIIESAGLEMPMILSIESAKSERIKLPNGHGYTTGSCATAATKAALEGLFCGIIPKKVSIVTPSLVTLCLDTEGGEIMAEGAKCGIRKYSGDDPDITNGTLIFATAQKIESGIEITGGIGVGVVTVNGLEVEIGKSAINKTPMKTIRDEVECAIKKYDYTGGIKITISVPDGAALAKKTYNPRLGIVGGISIIGTSGIVEPMSSKAIIDTIRVEMNVLKAGGFKDIVITPGNYGKAYIKEMGEIPDERVVKCSNFLGGALDIAAEIGFESVLLIGHIGKFIKVAGGVYNTHSNNCDCRLELLMASALKAGTSLEGLNRIMESETTEQGIEILIKEDKLEKTMENIMQKFDFNIKKRYGDGIAGGIIFSNVHGKLGQSVVTKEILKRWTK